MRASLPFQLCLSAASLFPVACQSDLWSRYVRDSEDSCLRVGCQSGGTCNPETGLCQGSTSDMGPTDMNDPTHGGYFGQPVPIAPTSLYEQETFFNMTVSYPEARGTNPEIWLAGASPVLTYLLPSDGGRQYTASTLKLEEQPCFLTSITGSVKGRQDVLVGQLAQKYSRGVSAAFTTYSSGVSGFKLISAGDLDNDGFPEAIITSSQLSLADQFYKGFPGSRSDGSSEFLMGTSDYGLESKSVGMINTPMTSVSIQHKLSKINSGFNVGLIPASRPNAAVLATVSFPLGGFAFTQTTEVRIPTSDFAFPVDVNGDELNDLVLVQLWDGITPFTGVSGAVYIAHNSGGEGKPSFLAEHIQPLPLEPGVVLGTKIDDFDQDGQPDLAVFTATLTGGEVLLYHNEAPSSTSEKTGSRMRYIGKMSATRAARAVEFVDLNRDGCKDVLMLFSGGLGSTGTGTNILWASGKKRGPDMPDCP